MKPQWNVRDIVWLMLVVSVSLTWWVDRVRMRETHERSLVSEREIRGKLSHAIGAEGYGVVILSGGEVHVWKEPP
jgi:hypothetical protein